MALTQLICTYIPYSDVFVKSYFLLQAPRSAAEQVQVLNENLSQVAEEVVAVATNHTCRYVVVAQDESPEQDAASYLMQMGEGGGSVDPGPPLVSVHRQENGQKNGSPVQEIHQSRQLQQQKQQQQQQQKQQQQPQQPWGKPNSFLGYRAYYSTIVIPGVWAGKDFFSFAVYVILQWYNVYEKLMQNIYIQEAQSELFIHSYLLRIVMK